MAKITAQTWRLISMKRYYLLLVCLIAPTALAGGGGLENTEETDHLQSEYYQTGESFLIKDKEQHDNTVTENLKEIRSQYPDDGSIKHDIYIQIGDLKEKKHK